MLIINARIITMNDKTYDNGFIFTKGDKIEKIGDMLDLNILSKQHIDANGGIVMPGFVDAHCHLGIIGDSQGFESDDTNEDTDPITPQLRAIDAVNTFDSYFIEASNAGVTSVLTGPGSANPIAGQWCAIKTLQDRIDDTAIACNVGMKFSLGENPKETYNHKSQTPVTRMGAVALIREQLIKAKRYIQDIEKAEEFDDEEPPEFDIKCESLISVLKRESKAFFHAHRADDIYTAIRIAEEFNLDYVLVHATEAYRIAEKLKSLQPNIITGPIICDRSKPELRGQTTRNTAYLKNMGLDVAICTDHPEVPINFLTLSAAICAKEGMGSTKALEAITINAARIAGIDKRVGSLEVGKDADILIFDKNPLEVMSAPTHVLINGILVKGELTAES